MMKKILPYLLAVVMAAMPITSPRAQSDGSNTGTGSGTGSAPITGSGSCIDRKQFQNELNGNQALVDSFCGLMMVEVGGMPDTCKVQFFESVMNRAWARKRQAGTIKFEIDTNINYWGEKGLRKPFNKNECDRLLRIALDGSNENNFNTDNSSAGLAKSNLASGKAGPRAQYCNGSSSELFSTDPWAEPSMKELIGMAPRADCQKFNGSLPSTGQPTNQGSSGGSGSGGSGSGGSGSNGGGTSSSSSSSSGGTTDPVQVHFNNMAEALKQIWVAAFQLMTEQMSANMMAQIQMVGMMFDAKEQLEAQRDIQRLTAQAHKDYHPSEEMCEIGTMVRDLADTQTRAKLTKMTVSNRLLARELSTGDVLTAEGEKSDFDSRMKDFRDNFCNQADNAHGLDYLCKGKDAPKEWKNRDINYTATLETPLTLDANFLDTTTTKEEQAVLSLVTYLFMHKPPAEIPPDRANFEKFKAPYQELRSVIAMRGVARSSIANIISQKTVGPENEGKGTPFIMALLKQMGLDDTEIKKMIGENPSYFAQMEVLTKTIYQDPTFIANLYDKPANVKRIRAAMQAIKLMQDRDIHEALMRREMLMSMILEVRLRQYQERLVNRVNGMINAQ